MFRRFVIGSLLSSPALVLAQPEGMSQEQMQNLMQGALQMQSCVAGIDQDQFEAMGKEADAMQTQLKEMCAAGDRDGAQAKAMAFGMEMARSETMEQLRSCGEMAMAMMPSMMEYIGNQAGGGDDKSVNKHVCDHL